MAYARFGEYGSDVYVWSDGSQFRCACCRFNDDDRDSDFDTRADLLAHLEEHRRRGDTVPDHTLERLKREMREGTG